MISSSACARFSWHMRASLKSDKRRYFLSLRLVVSRITICYSIACLLAPSSQKAPHPHPMCEIIKIMLTHEGQFVKCESAVFVLATTWCVTHHCMLECLLVPNLQTALIKMYLSLSVSGWFLRRMYFIFFFSDSGIVMVDGTFFGDSSEQIGHGRTLGWPFQGFRVPTKILQGSGCRFW